MRRLLYLVQEFICFMCASLSRTTARNSKTGAEEEAECVWRTPKKFCLQISSHCWVIFRILYQLIIHSKHIQIYSFIVCQFLSFPRLFHILPVYQFSLFISICSFPVCWCYTAGVWVNIMDLSSKKEI